MIPNFDLSGVLPPYIGPDPGATSALMSPYRASIVEVIEKFSTSPERRAILAGLLHYRDALSQIGVSDGFQWLDGSFVEDVETTLARPPGDIDVITFTHRPSSVTTDADWLRFMLQHQGLFDCNQTKATYFCDAFAVDLDTTPEALVFQTRYWFGLFSHQRLTFQWKGMLQVPLFGLDDVTAIARLGELSASDE
jgi:hypothetical protein